MIYVRVMYYYYYLFFNTACINYSQTNMDGGDIYRLKWVMSEKRERDVKNQLIKNEREKHGKGLEREEE